MTRRAVCVALITFVLGGCITEDTIRGALERTGQRAVDDAADSSYDAARSKAANAAEAGKSDGGGGKEKTADGKGTAAAAEDEPAAKSRSATP